MSEPKIEYKYDILVPSVSKRNKGLCETYTLTIRAMPVVGHRVWICDGKTSATRDLFVSAVEHYLSPESEEYAGIVNARHLDKEEASTLHKILKGMGLKPHSVE